MKIKLLLFAAKILGRLDRALFHAENSFYLLLGLLIIPLISLNIFFYSPIVFGKADIDEISNDIAANVFNNNLSSSFGEVLGAKASRLELVKKSEVPFPPVSAKAFLIADVNTNDILKSLNEDVRMPPASTTKLMTALVAQDIYESSETIKMNSSCANLETQSLGLFVDETYRFSDLLTGMIVYSAGDAACIIASYKTSYQSFVNLMNDKVREFGLENTNFVNPIGLDGENNSHYSTAYDLYVIASKAISFPSLRKLFMTKEAEFYPANSRSFKYAFNNTNKLLWELEGTVGIKTGKTQNAGEVLIYEYKKDKYDLMIVVLGSEDRFNDTRKILDWTLKSYGYE